jgi:phenylpropionate dioxygenase-like ring-hydroxylating dioxygenase large terminal subunit
MTTVEGPTQISRAYYRDEHVFEEELHRVFGKNWIFVGHESEVPAPGDYVTRRLGGDPVILSRTQDEGIRVMLNSCTHRGTQVCKVAYGNTTTFRCGYHGWVFGNDGRLKGVPGRHALYGPGFDLSKLGLRTARVETLHGFVFATWNEEGPSLQEYLGDFRWYLDALFDFFPGGMEVHGGIHRVQVRGNWKIHAENFSGDGYHLRIAHRTMFELGVMGAQAGAVEGFVVNEPHGHGVRSQYLVDQDVPDTVFGYEEKLLRPALERADAQHRKFRERTSVIHGLVFPNLLFITTAPVYFGEDAQGQTAFTQIRALTPIDQHTHEVAYWNLVPRDASDEWKARSYLFATRQHGASSYFEADDLENFRRINAGLGTVAGAQTPYNYELGIDAAARYSPPWQGPCRIVHQDLTESNQRNFVGRYLEVMEGTI